MSAQLAKLTAVHFYLNELQKYNLITPSIARPFPSLPINDEKLIVHQSYKRIQQNRINNISANITTQKKKRTNLFANINK